MTKTTSIDKKPTPLPFLTRSGAELMAMLRPHQQRRLRRELARAERRAARAAGTLVDEA